MKNRNIFWQFLYFFMERLTGEKKVCYVWKNFEKNLKYEKKCFPFGIQQF